MESILDCTSTRNLQLQQFLTLIVEGFPEATPGAAFLPAHQQVVKQQTL